MYKTIRPLLFLLPPELAHTVALRSLQLLAALHPAGCRVSGKTDDSVELMGLQFPNPVGLAAGLDKNADYVDGLGQLGFGFIEVGTITPRPQPGNPRPRLFRLPQAEAVINRMGFNNKGVEHLLEQLASYHYDGVIGINIGKNFATPVERAADDYLFAQRLVHAHADYLTLNISSPNTPGLRKLQQASLLVELLQPLKEAQLKLDQQAAKRVPLVLKIAPDLVNDEVEMIAEVVTSLEIDGLIATNTTLDRTKVDGQKFATEQGGLSGKPVFEKSTEILRQFRHHLGGDFPLIAAGGVSDERSMQAKFDAGANLVQVYTGLIYEGPGLISRLTKACHSSKSPA